MYHLLVPIIKSKKMKSQEDWRDIAATTPEDSFGKLWDRLQEIKRFVDYKQGGESNFTIISSNSINSPRQQHHSKCCLQYQQAVWRYSSWFLCGRYSRDNQIRAWSWKSMPHLIRTLSNVLMQCSGLAKLIILPLEPDAVELWRPRRSHYNDPMSWAGRGRTPVCLAVRTFGNSWDRVEPMDENWRGCQYHEATYFKDKGSKVYFSLLSTTLT